MANDVRLRTNFVNSTFVTDAEIYEYLNQALAELWARLVQGSGAPFYRSAITYAVTTASPLYPLPADFWQVQSVEATIDSITYTMRSFAPHERAILTNNQTSRYPYLATTRYRIQAENIEFQPVSQSFSATLYYSPAMPRLLSAGDTFDGYNGYEMAAIYDACASVCAKEESDPSFFMAQRDRIYKLIETLAGQRDASEPERVQDVMQTNLESLVGPYGTGWLP